MSTTHSSKTKKEKVRKVYSGTIKSNASKAEQAERREALTYKIDCSIPANDSIFDADILKGFQQYLLERIKVQGRTGNLRDKIKVSLEGSTIEVKTYIMFSKKYLKYLTKRYLKKKTLRDWLRVISTNRQEYQLRYFNIKDNEEEAEDV
eukprot:NODE_1824_length_1390_cov_186.490679_g1650_i0.p2 GENE.NODE_1824_length_1390_cov_186.490679_g1650_i0~~NODE_1824_length_1390_cov_186.490679_g1650_i0.p2  ORF type:complete len:149 (+),score=41.11 NODE_1824_length_1390_cov_186.490679_g1650_i0:830-1276(+)